jgi:hypothetical protein
LRYAGPALLLKTTKAISGAAFELHVEHHHVRMRLQDAADRCLRRLGFAHDVHRARRQHGRHAFPDHGRIVGEEHLHGLALCHDHDCLRAAAPRPSARAESGLGLG